MKVTTNQLFLGFLAVMVLMNGENIKTGIEKDQSIKTQQSLHSDRLKTNKRESREALDLSKVALERAKTCIKIVDASTKKDGYLFEGQQVLDTALKRPLRPAATVCSLLGDTGITDGKGAITDLARVSDSDMTEYKNTLKIK